MARPDSPKRALRPVNIDAATYEAFTAAVYRTYGKLNGKLWEEASNALRAYLPHLRAPPEPEPEPQEPKKTAPSHILWENDLQLPVHEPDP